MGEARHPTVTTEAWRLLRRARRRPGWVLALALVGAAAVVGVRARRADVYTARVVLRVTEGDLPPGASPRAPRRLREHVARIALATPRLLAIAEGEEIYGATVGGVRGGDPEAVLASFRDDVDIDAWRTDFIEERAPADAWRSGRVAISFRAADPEQATRVAAALARLVVDDAEEARRADATARERRAEREERALRERIAEAHAALARAELRLRGTDGEHAATVRGELVERRQAMLALEEQAAALAARRAELAVRASLQAANEGLSFEVAQVVRPRPRRLARWRALVAAGAAAFALLLPLAALVVGAFDGRVYDGDDVRRLGLASLGAVGAFPGDRVGSLRERLLRGSIAQRSSTRASPPPS